jgi:hypothetical protein
MAVIALGSYLARLASRMAVIALSSHLARLASGWQ